jgi:hypothetical protein
MKKNWLWVALLVAVAALGFTSHNALAQGAVTGAVIDADGNAVAGAQITLMGMMNDRHQRP